MNGAPGRKELWVRGIAIPEVHVFRAAKPDGSALLSLPGGGYEFLSVQNEGLDVAERFNRDGTTVFVLTYRLPTEGWSSRSLVPLQDAQRAMRLIRSRASDFHIEPSRLGVIGFSSGGHLAADLAVSFEASTYAPIDAADGISARPAFAGLLYPAIGLDRRTPSVLVDNLLGSGAPATAIEARSPERHVTSTTPPSFIAHAIDDRLASVDNSLEWIAACREAKVSVEALLLAEGGHGFGPRLFHLPRADPGSLWPNIFSLWMRQHGG